jgi:hypothetical protein
MGVILALSSGRRHRFGGVIYEEQSDAQLQGLGLN